VTPNRLRRTLSLLMLVLSFVIGPGGMQAAWGEDLSGSESAAERKRRIEALRGSGTESGSTAGSLCGGVTLLGVRSGSVLGIADLPAGHPLRKRWDELRDRIDLAVSACAPLMAQRSKLQAKLAKWTAAAGEGLGTFAAARSGLVDKLEVVEKKIDACLEATNVEQLYMQQAAVQAQAAEEIDKLCP
jgi:hypothetical protein